MRTYKNFKIKESKNGYGVFADKSFKTGVKVFQITGKLITCYEDDDIDDITRENTIRYDEERYLSPNGKIADYINHSCEPNSRVVKKGNKLFIVAILPIKKGEEVVFDYSTIIASDDSWTMRCNCGTKSCRGKVGQFVKLSKRIKEQYLANGMVPKYIQEVL